MKQQIRNIACVAVLGLAATSFAAVSVSTVAVGASTDFPTISISGGYNRSYSDVLTTPAGATIAGGGAETRWTTNGVAWGEVFKWAGSANGDVLAAFSMVVNSYSAGSYQPFLFDIGAVTFNANASTFNPSLFPNLINLGNVSLTLPTIAARTFVEFDLSGVDQITLTVGNSYAFGLLNTSTGNINVQRNSGTQSDPNGAPFQIVSGGLTSTSATVPGQGGGPRPLFFAVYTTPVPEPTSAALLGIGLLAMIQVIRRKRS